MSGWALASVGGLLAAFAGLSTWIRRAATRPAPAPLRITAQQRLDPRHTLWVVEVDGRRLLIGGGREGVRLLSDLSSSPP